MLNSLSRIFTRSFVRSSFIFLLIFSIVFTLFFWQLGSLTPGFSPAEKTALDSSGSLPRIASNPINGPHKLLQYASTQFDDSPLFARLPSVLLALLFLGCIYIIVRRWFGRMIAIFATLLFASLPWIILIARSATPDVLFLGATCLVAAYIWLSVSQRKTLALLALTGAAALLVYTPGMMWFLVIAAVVWHKKIYTSTRHMEMWAVFLAFLIFMVGISPLILASIKNTELLQQLALLPHGWPQPMEFLKTTIWGVLSFVWATRDPHPLVLGNLSLLPVTAIALSIFGLYIMWLRARPETFGLIALGLIAVLGYGLNNNLNILTLAFPTIGILMAAGLRYLYAEWKSVFPLNPLPKSLALILISSLVLLNLLFGIRYALAAWPNAITTKNTYVLK